MLFEGNFEPLRALSSYFRGKGEVKKVFGGSLTKTDDFHL